MNGKCQFHHNHTNAVDHKIQVKFDYGGIDIYLSRVIHLYLQQMDSVMNFIPQLNVPSIVTGDFNIDLSKSGSESKLTKFMHLSYNLFISWPSKIYKFL
jgi:hypothetical protein